MVWAPLVYGLLAGGFYSWGTGKGRPEEIAKSAALGAAGGAVIAFLITKTREDRATGDLAARMNAEHRNKRPYRGWSTYAP